MVPRRQHRMCPEAKKPTEVRDCAEDGETAHSSPPPLALPPLPGLPASFLLAPDSLLLSISSH